MNIFSFSAHALNRMFAVLVVISFFLTPIAQVAAQSAVLVGTDSVGICHAAGGSGNYTTPPTDVNGIVSSGHDGHDGDIIPPFTYNLGEGDIEYPGKNWDEVGQAIWENDCVVPTTSGDGDGDGDGIATTTPPTEDDVVTVTAHKIVCEEESDLPNWGLGGPSIDGNTAIDWVATHDSCEFVSDWNFEWRGGEEAPGPSDSVVGPIGDPWTVFGPTDSEGKVILEITEQDLASDTKLWFREVLQDGYIPFTNEKTPDNSDDISAEFYCHEDVLNYDNYEWIDEVELGDSYNCVAWNVLEETEEPEMCSITVVSDTTNTEDGAAAVLVSFIHDAWDAVIDGASWIWGDDPVADPVNDTVQTFTKTFDWNGPVTASVLDIAADNSYEVFLNGVSIASSTVENNFGTSTNYTGFGGEVITGENTLSIEVKNWVLAGGTSESNPAGLLYKMTLTGNTEVDCTEVPTNGGDGDGDGDGDGRYTLTILTTGYGQGKIEGGEAEEATSTILCLTDVGEGDDCSETYPEGTEVTLVVTPYEGSNFDNSWTVGAGTCVGNTTPCTVIMDSNIDLTAHFDLNDGSDGGGGGGGSSRRSSSSSSDDDEPVPQVLGAQTEIMPIGAPNAGAGGTSNASTAISFALLAMIVGAGFTLRRFAN